MKQNKINIILITVYFPPLLSVASNRMIAFAKYLDKEKFNVSVVTLSHNNNFHHEVIENAEVYYIPNRQFFKMATFKTKAPYLIHKLKAGWNRLLMSTGSQENKSWINSAIKKVNELIIPDGNNILISSYPTEEPLKVCMKIKSEKPDVKWVADLRDSILLNPYLTERQRKKNINLENVVLEKADLILSVSEPILSDLKKKSNRLNCLEVRNGFDFNSPKDYAFGKRFTITYAGTFYAERNPDRFFKVLIDLIESKKISEPVINFIGVSGGIIIPKQLKNIVHCVERIEYEKVIPILFNSDALLLIQPGSEYKGLFSGKVFDYLGAMRPIVALVDKEDVAAKLIEECGAGFVSSFDNEEEISVAILNAFELWKNKRILNYNQELIQMHQRRIQVRELGEHLISLVS